MEDADLLTAHFCSRAARDLAQQINRKEHQLRAFPAAGLQSAISPVYHQVVYALLKHYVFPDECVEAGVEAITTILKAHCYIAFGREYTPHPVFLCC